MRAYRKFALFLLIAATLPVALPAQAPKPQAPPKPAAEAQSAQEKSETTPVRRSRVGKRDPFVSVIRTAAAGGPPCAGGGKKCLLPERVLLRGIVISDEDAIAVVENSERKTYMLRQGDLLLNGEVVRISQDSLVMRQRFSDRLGRVATREVVKRLARSHMFPEGVSGFSKPSGGTGVASHSAPPAASSSGSTGPTVLGMPF